MAKTRRDLLSKNKDEIKFILKAVESDDITSLQKWIDSRSLVITVLDIHGNSLFHIAAMKGKVNILELLGQDHPLLNVPNKNGVMPLTTSLIYGKPKATKSLLTMDAKGSAQINDLITISKVLYSSPESSHLSKLTPELKNYVLGFLLPRKYTSIADVSLEDLWQELVITDKTKECFKYQKLHHKSVSKPKSDHSPILTTSQLADLVKSKLLLNAEKFGYFAFPEQYIKMLSTMCKSMLIQAHSKSSGTTTSVDDILEQVLNSVVPKDQLIKYSCGLEEDVDLSGAETGAIYSEC